MKKFWKNPLTKALRAIAVLVGVIWIIVLVTGNDVEDKRPKKKDETVYVEISGTVTPNPQPETKPEVQPEVQPDTQIDTQPETKPEAITEPEPKSGQKDMQGMDQLIKEYDKEEVSEEIKPDTVPVIDNKDINPVNNLIQKYGNEDNPEKSNEKKVSENLTKELNKSAFVVSDTKKYSMFLDARNDESKKKDNIKIFPWAIDSSQGTGLSTSYKFFSMRIIAVSGEKKYDLETGKIVLPGELDKYSQTAILSGSPEKDFPVKLQNLKKKFGNKFDSVRYYMWPDTAIYFSNKVDQAVKCLISDQLVPDYDTLDEHLLIIGKVYEIKKPGSDSHFGVFLPTKAVCADPETKKEKSIVIQINCFKNHQDIKMLQQ